MQVNFAPIPAQCEQSTNISYIFREVSWSMDVNTFSSYTSCFQFLKWFADLRSIHNGRKWKWKRNLHFIVLYHTKNRYKTHFIFTTRKRSLRRLCFYTCLSVHRGVVSQHALQVSRPTPRGEVEGSGLGEGLQAHTQGGSWGVWPGASPGPHPGGKLRGLAWGVSRPTSAGGLQAHTWEAGLYRSMHWDRHSPSAADSYCCGQYASYWNAFLFESEFPFTFSQREFTSKESAK